MNEVQEEYNRAKAEKRQPTVDTAINRSKLYKCSTKSSNGFGMKRERST